MRESKRTICRWPSSSELSNDKKQQQQIDTRSNPNDSTKRRLSSSIFVPSKPMAIKDQNNSSIETIGSLDNEPQLPDVNSNESRQDTLHKRRLFKQSGRPSRLFTARPFTTSRQRTTIDNELKDDDTEENTAKAFCILHDNRHISSSKNYLANDDENKNSAFDNDANPEARIGSNKRMKRRRLNSNENSNYIEDIELKISSSSEKSLCLTSPNSEHVSFHMAVNADDNTGKPSSSANSQLLSFNMKVQSPIDEKFSESREQPIESTRKQKWKSSIKKTKSSSLTKKSDSFDEQSSTLSQSGTEIQIDDSNSTTEASKIVDDETLTKQQQNNSDGVHNERDVVNVTNEPIPSSQPSTRTNKKLDNVALENGCLTLQDKLPSKPSLISKTFSKFRRKNRIVAIQQNIVGVDLEQMTSTADAQLPGTKSKAQHFWEKIIFDVNENYFYYWLAIFSTAYVYNLLVVIARTVFIELAEGYLSTLWLAFDLCSDFVYITDMFVRSRTGFLEQGLLIRDGKKIFSLYIHSFQFKLDLTSILPFDYFSFIISRKPTPFLRFNRLLRRDRIQKFMEQTETRSSLPNVFRVGVVVWYIAIIIHWNACFYFMISESIGLGSDGWVYGKLNGQSLPANVSDTLTRRYIYSFYWSTLILTTIGEVPGPQQNIEFAFVTIDLMCGVLIFATIVGNVGSMISNMSAARTEFQIRIDNIKQYMELRKVGKQLEVRVIKWFDYLWANKQNLADQQVLKVLPDKLQAEIAMHVHFETLRKVRIFQDCEAGLLAELVLKLQLQVFSPMDYVCRKGDIGREMYIVKRGMLQVVADDGNRVFATLSEGAVFGELSILNIAGSKNGNRRTANVRSVGYTDLFVLNKNDLWIALKEYPETRKILIQKGRELLRKDNLLDENAPEENKTAEEIADELQSSVRILQTRIARLTAEHTNTETKLRERIEYLEKKLYKYNTLLRKTADDEDNDEASTDNEMFERHKLLQGNNEDY